MKLISGPTPLQMAVYTVNRNKVIGQKRIDSVAKSFLNKKMEDSVEINMVVLAVEAQKMCSSATSL